MRISTSLLVSMALLAGACGGSNSASGSHTDASTCSVGALGCACTTGGGCDPGDHCDPALHICVSNIGSGGSGGAGVEAGAGSGGTSGSGAAGSAGASGSGGTAGAGGTSSSAGTGGAGGLPDGIGILPCGGTTCTAPQACCYKYQQVTGSSTYQSSWTCIDPSTTSCASCTGTNCRVTLIECHGKGDCASGQLCCGTFNGSKTGYASLACSSQCSAPGSICDPNDPQPCPIQFTKMVCNDTSMLPGYHNCAYP